MNVFAARSCKNGWHRHWSAGLRHGTLLIRLLPGCFLLRDLPLHRPNVQAQQVNLMMQLRLPFLEPFQFRTQLVVHGRDALLVAGCAQACGNLLRGERVAVGHK